MMRLPGRRPGPPRSAAGVPGVLRARLRPGTLAATLVAGFVVTFVLGALFAELLDGVLEGNGLTTVDKPVTRFLAAHRTVGWTRLFTALTDLGGAALLVPVTALLAVAIAWRGRSWRPIWVTAVALGGVQLLVFSLKQLVGRPRPAAALAVAPTTGYSFPSGHSTSSFVAFTVLAGLSMTVVAGRLARTAVWLLAGLLVVGVGLSRMYLGVHYLTDVLGAWILAATWLSALWTSLKLAAGLRSRPAPAGGSP
jgi:membrane-associated phospholipid phosphatase